MRRIYLIGGIMLVALVTAVLVSLNSVSADQSEATYVGTDICKTCHDTITWNYKYESWKNTSHGIDFATEWEYHDEITNKYTYSSGSCVSCHVIGYNQTDKGGYDPAYAWDSTENANLLGIGCENCHGPGSEHRSSMNANDINQVVDQYAGSCSGTADASCHGGARQYGNDTIPGWDESLHAKATKEPLPTYVTENVDCSHCMSTEGGIANLEGTTLTTATEDLTWGVRCGVCHDPHPDSTNTNTYQLRATAEEICEQCHYTTSELGDEEIHHPTKEMREGNAGADVTDTTYMSTVNCVDCHMYSTGHGVTPVKQGHSWTPQPEACVVCHDGTTVLPVYNVTTAQAEIDKLHTNFTTTYNTVKPNIDTMKEKKTYAEEKGVWTTSMNNTYSKALWNFGLAEADGSNGAHNPDYSEALMQDANTKALEVIDAVDAAPLPQEEEEDKGIPGFEAIGIIVALGIAFIILRRRKFK